MIYLIKKLIRFIVRVLSLTLITLFVFFSSVTVYNIVSETDKEIIPYVKTFEKHTGTKVDYSVRFYSKLPDFLGLERMIGVCFKFVGNVRFVMLNGDRWTSLSSDQKKFLTMHEFAHCTLDLPHNDEMLKNGCEKFLMNSYMVDSYCVKKMTSDYYLNTVVKESEKQGNKVIYFNEKENKEISK
jgi:hypothetical protein